MNAMKGTQSIAFSESPYLVSAGSVAGKKEGEGPLGKYFDIASEDDLFGEKTWELAEGTMQKLACKLALKNAGVQPEEVRYLFGGDLLRQGIATSMGAEELQIPVFGLFGACSTSGEALALAAMTVAAGYGDLVLAATSSHFGSAEKEFRFPLGYANQRPLSSTWTVTGSGAFLVGKKKSRVRISGVTIGKIVDYGLKDSQNMGACMAPAACDTILQNLMDFGRGEKDYDRIMHKGRGPSGRVARFGAARRGTGRAHRAVRDRRPGNLSVAEKRTYARVPARDRLPAPAHEHVRSRTAHPPRHGLRDTQVFQRQGILLSPHSADHGQRRRGRRRHVSGHDARPEQRAEERHRRGRLCAGFLRQTLQPDRIGPARGRARRAGAVADLHVRADVPGRKLEYAPTFGRILDDRARNGVL